MEAGPRRRGHKPRQPHEQVGEQEFVVDQNQEQGTNVGDPVPTALNQMTDLLERIVPQ